MSNKTLGYVKLVALIILMINQALIVFGYNPLPFSEEQIYEALSTIALIVTGLYTTYKNTDLTDEAVAGTAVTKKLKNKKLSDEESQAYSKVKR